jgi:hypothetical protein
VCDLGVSVRNRDAGAGVTVDCLIGAVVGGSCGDPIPFWGAAFGGLAEYLDVLWLRRMVLCPGSGRIGLAAGILSGPRTANGDNEAASDGGYSTQVRQRVVLHDCGIDANPFNRVFVTLSTECYQSVRGNTDTPRTHTHHGLS